MRTSIVVLLALSCAGCSSASELQTLCNRTDLAKDPGLAKYDGNDRYTVYFSEVSKSARTPSVRQAFQGMAQTNPLDRPAILRAAVNEAKLARCPLLDQIDAFYLGDPVTGCAPFDPDACHPRKIDAAFLAAWAKLPAKPGRGIRLERATDSDLQNLARLTSLRFLDLTLAPGVSRVDALAAMAGLEHLDLHNSDLASAAPLGKLVNLETLNLDQDAKLTSLAGLESLAKLRELNVRGTAVADFSPLRALPNLKALDAGKITREQLVMLKQSNPGLRVEHD